MAYLNVKNEIDHSRKAIHKSFLDKVCRVVSLAWATTYFILRFCCRLCLWNCENFQNIEHCCGLTLIRLRKWFTTDLQKLLWVWNKKNRIYQWPSFGSLNQYSVLQRLYFEHIFYRLCEDNEYVENKYARTMTSLPVQILYKRFHYCININTLFLFIFL